jgi:hypothetical protein
MLAVANHAALRANSVQERRNTMTAKGATITVLAVALIAAVTGLGYMVSIATIDTADSRPLSPSLVPLEIDLPNPIPGGTPQNVVVVPHLEKRSTRPRLVVPAGTTNVALGKPVTSTDDLPIIGEIEYITDGDKQAAEGCVVQLAPGLQHITIDLGAPHEIFATSLWHYYRDPHVYFDCIVQFADDPDFITNVRTLFNNDHDNSAGLGVGTDLHYIETNEGKLIDAKGQIARFVRLYSNGNALNDMNYYTEVEVYGKPVQ